VKSSARRICPDWPCDKRLLPLAPFWAVLTTLLAVLNEPIEVHIEGGGFSWPALLAPAAIVIAAYVAARYARHRLHVEIAATDRRQRQQLEHDRKEAARRQDRQLNHDRSMREREAMRATVDDVFTNMTQTTDNTIVLWNRNEKWQQVWDELEAIDPEDPGDVDFEALSEQCQLASDERLKALQDAGTALYETSNSLLRLQLRFPDEHPVVETFNEWLHMAKKWFDLVGDTGKRQGLSDEETQAIRNAAREAGKGLHLFRQAVRGWIEEDA